MDQNAERRHEDRLRAERPLLKRRHTWVERKDRPRPEFFRDWVDDTLRPSIKRVSPTIDMRCECVPHRAAGITNEEDCLSALQPGVEWCRVKPAAENETVRRRRRGDIRKSHSAFPICHSGTSGPTR